MKRLAILVLVAGLARADDGAFFRDLGDREGIHRIVAALMPLVLADARIKDSFEGTDTAHIARRLEEQFCALSGGPCVYKGKDMATIHDGLNITDAQFNALAEDLQEAMARSGVPSAAQNKLLAKLAPLQRVIVTR